jgi:ERCC4-related helicase
MVKPLNRMIRNQICFVYRTPASDAEGLKQNDQITVLDISKGGDYTVLINGKKHEINRVSAKLVMVFE